VNMRRIKRKKSSSPAKDNVVEKKTKQNPKVPVIPAPVVPVSSTSTRSMSSQPVANAQVPDGKFTKPIFVNTSIQVVKNILISANLSTKPICKVRSSNSTQVSCFNLDDKKKLINKLKSQAVEYHTFTDPAEKPKCFVLKGFYHLLCQDLLSLLVEEGVNAVKVTDLIRKDNYVMYIVHFTAATNVNILNHNHRIIDGIIVKWENLKKSSSKATQCFNCQKWGHSSVNCGLPTRCVKCTDSHAKGNCPRVSREGDPKCCNCGGNHSANHRGCPAFKKHLEDLIARQKKASVIVRRSAASTPQQAFPIKSLEQFPRLSNSQPDPCSYSSVSFAEKVKESNNNISIATKLIQVREKFKSISNFEETLDILLKIADEIHGCDDHLSRSLIIMKYCVPISNSYHGN
jgi:hypothetical protein